MLSIQDRASKLCDGWSRREILRVGGLSLLGLSLPQLVQAREQNKDQTQGATFGRAKNVIFLYLAGGPPQHETFDPKPNAPLEIRGEFQAISTNVPGIQFCELLPRTARIADRLAVVRSMATDDNIHSSSSAWVLTGHKYAGTNARTIQPSDWPYFGSIVKMLKPSETLPALSTVWIPDWMRLNENVTPAGQTGGLLGRHLDPERFIGDPSQTNYKVDGLQSSDDVIARLQVRRELLRQLDNRFGQPSVAADFGGFDNYQAQAFDVITSGKAVNAFGIEKESAATRERYGMNAWGQCALMARRLIEAGVRLVHVQWPRMPGDNAVDNPLWDTHAQNFDRLEDVLCPVFDVGFSALIEDLDQRGLLDETLVVAIGEFGRTPTINANAGRDHWGNVFSCALAGAGISGGQVFGASDNHGAYPIADRVEPGDLIATIYHLLGIDYKRILFTADGRAVPVTHGKPIEKLLGLSPSTRERTTAGGDPARVPPYKEQLLTYNTFGQGTSVRSFDGSPRPKGWRASAVLENEATGFGLKIVEPKTRTAPFDIGHIGVGIFANANQVLEIKQGQQVMLSQEVRSPFAGKFVLSVLAAGYATGEEEFELFRKNFACRFALIQFLDKEKHPDAHKVLASADIQPTWLNADKGDGLQRYQLEKEFLPPGPGQNISFGLGLGVALIVEKTSSGVLAIDASAETTFIGLRIAKIELEFAGKERNEDVRV